MKLSDLIDFNPRTQIAKGSTAPFADMASLPTGERYFPIEATKEFKGSGSKFQDGDTLLARITPCLENGKGGFVKGLGANIYAHGSTEFIVMRAKTPTDADFVYYISKHPEFREHAIKQMSGTSGRQRVAWQSLADYEIHDLSESEREQFGLTLSALDDKIELNRRMNATLEAMARAIFRDWFVTFGPTRAKMAGAEPYLPPETWSVFPDRLDENGVPEGWEEKPLSEFFSILGGGTPKTKEPAYWGGNIPWYSVVDAPSGSNVYVHDTEKKITDRGLQESSAKLVREGTTIISARGTVGKLAMAAQEMTFNQSCYGLQGEGSVGDCFTYLAAQHMVSRLQAMAHGSVFSTITRATFQSLNLAKPKDHVFEAFKRAAQPLFEKMKANGKESRTLAQTRDLLLPKLMSGEVRVGEAEGIVEGVA